MSIAGFRGAHQGEDVYVLAAGGTLNYLDRGFFTGKTTVALNYVAPRWGIRPTYALMKEHACIAPNVATNPDVPIIVARYDCGSARDPIESGGTVHVFDHRLNRVEAFDAARDWPTDPDQLVVSWSTITTAMHFAAYLGAATIILVGHDCGQLGDRPYLEGYAGASLDWLLRIEVQTRAVKAQLVARYGVRVYSLNPFLNYNLEGVPFVGANRINEAVA